MVSSSGIDSNTSMYWICLRWSMFNPALVKILGVVTSSGDDWSLGQVVWIFQLQLFV